jgi:TetR/AcrR family transcriptional repressor of nem operon
MIKCMSPPRSKPAAPDARAKLLVAALKIIRERGYGATSVDALCAEAGVTKGAFFHHFNSKEELGTTSELFAAAPYHRFADPLKRILAYIDFRTELLDGPLAEITCLAGTMVQESYQTSEAIRVACNASISDHAATLEADIAAAAKLYGVTRDVDAKSLALHTQAVLQGAFILAKAKGDVSIAIDSIKHLKRYFKMLFTARAELPKSKGDR